MENTMKSLLNISILLSILFLGCNKENITEINPELFGSYESSAFTEPGSNDGGVNIQANGGYLKITLNEDFNYYAELLIPDNVSSNYPTGLTNYSGTFKLVNESIIFNSTFIISELLWKNDDKILITPEVSLRGQPLNIIMYKNIR